MQRSIPVLVLTALVLVAPVFAGGDAETDDTIELNVLVGHWTVGSDDSPFEAAKRELEARYPGVTVVFDVQQGGGNVKSKLLNATAAGQSPDVAMVDSNALGEMVDAGLLAPLDSYVNDWQEWSDILPNFRRAGSWDGATYAVFMNTDLRVFVWNRRLFAAAGLDPDDGPDTWDEVLAIARAINDPPRVYGMMVPGGSSEHLAHRWYSFLWGAGGDIIVDGQAAFDRPGGVRAAQFYRDLITAGVMPLDVLAASPDDNDRGVASGAYAMGVVGSWFYNYTREVGVDTVEAFNAAFGVSVIPGPDGSPSPAGAGGWTVTIPAQSEHRDLAWEFISIAMNRENQRTWAISRAYVPVRRSLAEDTAFTESIPFYPVIEQTLPIARTRPAIPEYPQVSAAIQTALQSIMLGEAGAGQPGTSIRLCNTENQR